MLWCRFHLVRLVFEGSIPTCTCFHSENFFVTCKYYPLFSTFNSSIYSKMHIVHIQSVDSSILAGAFLTTSFCVVPESSYSSNTAISTLVIVWSSNCSIAASSIVSVVASFKNFQRRQQKLAVVQVSLTSCGLLLCLPKTLCRHCAHKAHIHVVLSRKTPLKQQFYSEYL